MASRLVYNRVMTTLALLALLGTCQDGPHLPLSEKALSRVGRDDRMACAYYYSRDASNARRDLQEMGRIGVDTALVLGGDAASMEALAKALEQLETEGRDRPRVAPAIDPAALEGADLSTEQGRKRLYGLIRGFYSRVPPRAWAVVDGRPILWLLPPSGVKYDKDLVAALQASARADFDGRDLFVVADVSWQGLPADRVFAWGAAHAGPRELPIVSVGPGSAKPERRREEGKFYERSWYVALRLEPRWLAIETWNGAAEGTDVAESKEHQRKYLEATENRLRRFRLGEKMALPKGKWTGAPKALYTAKYYPHEQGLGPVATAEGAFEYIQLRGIAMLLSKEGKAGARRLLCLDVDDSFSFFERRSFDVEVEFLDSGEGVFSLEYDAWDKALEMGPRAVKSAGERRFTATGEWRTEKFDLPDARFGNLQPGGSDFRLVTEKRGLAVRRISLIPK